MTFARALITGDASTRPRRNHDALRVGSAAAIAPLFADDLTAWSTMADIVHASAVHDQQLCRDPA
jgi:hypothetical protein